MMRGTLLWSRRGPILAGILGFVLLVGLVAALAALSLLRRSLPRLDGRLEVPGIAGAIRIERDDLGVPTITAEQRLDVSFGLGFLHAQERFFQMDLLRRSAAGELAALFGPSLLQTDASLRVHRFRARARELLHGLPHEEHLEAYAAGVNAGLAALRARPFEYWLLRQQPEAWRPEDTLLCVFAMYLDLQPSEGAVESARGVLVDLLPPAVAAFLDPLGTAWDAPLWGGPFEPPEIPGPEVFDRRRAQRVGTGPAEAGESGRAGPAGVGEWGCFDGHASRENPLDVERRGSNQWAVAPEHSADGSALLAGDMHLGLRVPNIWYRAALQVPRAAGMQRLVGITLPGTPVLVAGSNGQVAWCFTNSQIDVSDLVVLETAGDSAYATPAGMRRFEDHLEVLHVRGARDDTLQVRETIWGPLLDRDHRGRQRAYRWLAYEREAVNLGLLEMEEARSAVEAMDLANRTGIPTQNFLVVDRQGHIGWTLIGAVPSRFGHDGRVPRSWADGRCGWNGVLPPEAHPRLLDPPIGRLWTANNRVVGGGALEPLGDGGYALGARARQIRDALLALEAATPSDMLSLQLDDRALFLSPWRDLFLDALEGRDDALEPHRRVLRRLVEDWGGRAEVQSVGYRGVREFRDVLSSEVFTWILQPLRRAEPRVRTWQLRQREGPLWQLLQERPMHWLDPRYVSWDALLQAAADTVLLRWSRLGADVTQRTWGERNTLRMRHPLSRAVPALAGWLDMPRQPMPGDQNMPRVQSPTSGASQRMVVSPGREEQGFFHMPGGQSGHPLSPFYRRGHRAWLEGRPTPFLPGPPTHRLLLLPSRRDSVGADQESM